MVKLTIRTVRAAVEAHEGRERFVWDEEIKGFGLRINPSGVSSYLIQYRTVHGQTRRLSLGSANVVTPELARQRARIELGRVQSGNDPSAERTATRQAITVAQLCDEYLKVETELGRIKKSTLAMDRSRIERHVKPLLGSRPVAALSTNDIETFLRDVVAGKTARVSSETKLRGRGGVTTGGQGVAARTVSMLGTILERAIKAGAITRNPVRGVRRPADARLAPPFSFDFVRQLGVAIKEASESGENATAISAIKLLLLTGCRRNEILSLRSEAIDTRGRCFRFADTKSGPQLRPVGKGAFVLLEAVPRAQSSAYVFAASTGAGHFVGLPRVWKRLLTRAQLPDMPLHSLRHWFASAAAELGFSELTIAGLLGHRVKGVTARYAVVPDSSLASAADHVSARLLEALDNREPDHNIVRLEVASR
ncbi:hypothetical protein sos41_02460 [Alphaproteobacteria bacterium SO-S41]|nr:hypothetical protein sos41_02460 [Alphaproteobacteria bacterium SO-S41]